MPLVPFTQYLLPNGRTRLIEINVSDEAAAKAKTLLEQPHYRFEVEILTTGEVSLTCFDSINEDTIAIEVIPNGPGMVEAVERLITSAYNKQLETS